MKFPRGTRVLVENLRTKGSYAVVLHLPGDPEDADGPGGYQTEDDERWIQYEETGVREWVPVENLSVA